MDIDTFALMKHMINLVRTNSVELRFNGHYEHHSQQLLWTQTEYAKNETVDWMKSRHNEMFVAWYNLHLLEQSGNLTTEIVDKWMRRETTEYLPVAQNDCFVCGKRVETYFNGFAFMFADAKSFSQSEGQEDDVLNCEFAGGMKDYSVEIEVKSGRLVFANDLRCCMPDDIDDHDVNQQIGVRNTVIDTAKQGFLTAFVGNSCPSVFQNGTTLYVGNEGHDENDNVIAPLEGRRLGSICTDLWWFYAMDGDVYDACNVRHKPEDEAIAELPPGTYRMTVHTNAHQGLDWDAGQLEKYATIEKV